MPRKKNLFDYLFLTLFAMCIGLALCACMHYVTRATEREFLNQGIWVLSMAGLCLLALLCARVAARIGMRLKGKTKDILLLVCCAVLVGVGIYLRLWVIWNIPLEPDSDFETYYRMAGELLHDTMMSAEAEPDRNYVALYPHTIGFPMLVLLPVFSIFGQSVTNALYANLVCSVIAILLAGHVAYRLFGRIGTVVTVALMSLWPSHIFYSSMVATEPSFTMMLMVSLEIMVSVMDRRQSSLYVTNPGRALGLLVLLGVVLALAGAIRPLAAILLAAWCVVQMTVKGDPTRECRLEGARYAISQPVICIVLVIVSYAVTGMIISRSIADTIGQEPASGLSASGYNLMVGLNTQSGGLWNETDSTFFADAFEETGSANAAHQACMQVALTRIQSEPENVLNLMVSKFCDLWGTDDFGIDWNLLWAEQQNLLTPELKNFLEEMRPIGRVMYMALLLFAALGCMEAWRQRYAPDGMIFLCMLFFLGTALSHMLLETQVRYHYNMIPFLILIAAWTVQQWSRMPQDKETLRIVYQDRVVEPDNGEDHTHFDMAKALADGHIFVSTTWRIAEETVKKAAEERKAAESKKAGEAAAQNATDDVPAEIPPESAENPPETVEKGDETAELPPEEKQQVSENDKQDKKEI